MLAAGLVLAVMVVPFIASVAREILKAVPVNQREAAYALGATRWEAIRMAMYYARTGIIGAVMLGLGRALGETMAVTMVIGNNPQISWSLFAPQYTMAAVIANEFTEAAGELYLDALVEIGLVLFTITIVINIVLAAPHLERERASPGPSACCQAEARAGGLSMALRVTAHDARRKLLSRLVEVACAAAVVVALDPPGPGALVRPESRPAGAELVVLHGHAQAGRRAGRRHGQRHGGDADPARDRGSDRGPVGDRRAPSIWPSIRRAGSPEARASRPTS